MTTAAAMNPQTLIAEENRIREAVKRQYLDPTGRAFPIYDGVFNAREYAPSSPRILWILKEPYDGGITYEGGD